MRIYFLNNTGNICKVFQEEIMNIRLKLGIIVTLGVIVFLAACDSTAETKSTNIDHATEESQKVENDQEINNSESYVHEDNKTEEKNEQTVRNDQQKEADSNPAIQITSGKEAVSYLKKQLEEGKNEDISFGVDETLRSDAYGSYYTIQLVDIPLRLAGKTGNLGYYKVYQDGKYEPLKVETSNTEPQENSDVKEKLLAELNRLDKEIGNMRKNSKAITTQDIEEEEMEIYQIWDDKLNEIYGFLHATLSDEQMERLREEQRQWIIYRDEMAKKASEKFKGGSMESIEYISTQTRVTRERCYEFVYNFL